MATITKPIDLMSVFGSLNVDIKPLPKNYSPDKFARDLMQGDLERPYAISYSTGTHMYSEDEDRC